MIRKLRIGFFIERRKNNKSNTKEINKSIDIIEKISEFVELKLKGKMKEVKCYRDGTSAVFEK